MYTGEVWYIVVVIVIECSISLTNLILAHSDTLNEMKVQ